MQGWRIRFGVALLALVAALMPASGRAETVLRFIPQADLRSIDPIWTTAYVTRNFGYLVFDTLFSVDKLADQIQIEAYTKEMPYVPTGQFLIQTAYRKNLGGIIIAPVAFLWNVEKK